MGRIDTLLAAMTIEEKIGQLNMVPAGQTVTGPGELRDVHDGIRAGRIGALLNLWGAGEVQAVQRLAVEESRLAIPLLLGLDVIHGHRTIFPVPLAEACLFAPELWEKTARAAAEEAAQDGVAMTFAPMLDVARDPRWGRIVESPGEDPWVASKIAAAKTRGFQGHDLAAADSVAATAKHFCAYGAVTAGREYASAEVSERTLREIYLPPFSAAVAAGTAAIMPAFIDIAGAPMTANAPLLKGWLRGDLGFDGVLISDYNAIAELLNHGVAGDLAEAAALALNAGVDIDMTSNAYVRGLPEALKRGLVTITEIDASVRRVLRLKERLGLFDDPYRRRSAEPHGASAAERRELAREAGRRAIVLLTSRAGSLAALHGTAAHRPRWPPGRGPARDAGTVGVGRPRTERRIHSGRAQSRTASIPDQSCARGRHSGRRHRPDIGRRRTVRRRRSRGYVPWRSRRHEWRSGKSSGYRPSGTPARTRRGSP